MNHPDSRTNRCRDANPKIVDIRTARDRAGLTRTEAEEIAARLAAGLREELFCRTAVKAEPAADMYVTRYGLRSIAKAK